MAEAGYGRKLPGKPTRREEVRRHHREDIGDDAVAFTKWYVRNKFQLMESFVHELDKDPIRRNPVYLRERFLHAVQHAQKVLLVRGVVTALLALSAVTAFVSTILDRVYSVPVLGDTVTAQVFVEATRGLFATVAAVAGSLTLVLLVARLAMDRYLELTEVSAHYTAMQLANAR